MATVTAITSTTREKLERARKAAGLLAQLSTEQKDTLLHQMADAIETNSSKILSANEEDLAHANLSGAMRDCLLLNASRIAEMAKSVRDVAALPDPVGEVIESWTRPNGLHIRKVRVPLGVVGIVYESRPNVTVDAAVLAFAEAKKLRAAMAFWLRFSPVFQVCLSEQSRCWILVRVKACESLLLRVDWLTSWCHAEVLR